MTGPHEPRVFASLLPHLSLLTLTLLNDHAQSVHLSTLNPSASMPSTQAPFVVADVGGTNARFACARWVAGDASDATPLLRLEHVLRLEVDDHASIEAAARHYLAHAEATSQRQGEGWHTPRALALAVASPITGDTVSLTNGPWSFSRRQLRQSLGLERLRVLNDFEALALSLPRLAPHQWRLGADSPPYEFSKGKGVDSDVGRDATALTENSQLSTQPVLAVVGPGTGLGVGAVVRTPQGWQALPGEGGHATLAAADAFEAEVIAQAWRHHPHVSAERFLSGTGLPTLHRAVAAVMGHDHGVDPTPTPERIVEQGLARSDVVCDRTIDVFCALLGGFCGNVALTYGSQTALFVGGGIVPRLGERFFRSTFRARFEGKGRYATYLSSIPTPLITDTMAALTGAAWALQDA